jgi:hypothetical protein
MITNGNVETIGIEGEIIDGMIGIEIGKGMSDVIGIRHIRNWQYQVHQM